MTIGHCQQMGKKEAPRNKESSTQGYINLKWIVKIHLHGFWLKSNALNHKMEYLIWWYLQAEQSKTYFFSGILNN